METSMQMPTELTNMKNLGVATVNILGAVGIHTPEELREAGAVETYCRIRERGIRVSKVMLYALQGALMDVHWNDLSPDLKAQLVQEADNHEQTSKAS